jgi:hypothetical protein
MEGLADSKSFHRTLGCVFQANCILWLCHHDEPNFLYLTVTVTVVTSYPNHQVLHIMGEACTALEQFKHC